MTKPTWKRSYIDPNKPGFYWWKASETEDPEIVWAYPSTFKNSRHSYQFSTPGIMLRKRFHDPSAEDRADKFMDMHLVYPGETHPRPIERPWEAAGEPEVAEAAKPKGKQKRARKTSERTEAAQEADPVGTPSDLPPSAT